MNKLILAAPAILIGAVAFSCLAQAQEPTNPVGFTLSCNIPAAQLTCSAAGFFAGREKGRFAECLRESARAIRSDGSTLRLYILRQSA